MKLKSHVLVVHFLDGLMILMAVHYLLISEQYDFSAVIAAALILFGICCSVIVQLHFNKCMSVYKNTIPLPMILNFKEEKNPESTDYFARFESLHPEERWEVLLLPVALKDQRFDKQNIPAKVYFDPVKRKPLVIETSEGILCAMSGNRAVKITADKASTDLSSAF